jgi:hypothetical protein
MKTTFRILLFIILVISFSCEEQGLFIKCADCLEDEPVKAIVEARLESSLSYPEVIVNVWEGNLEDSVLLGTYTFPREKLFTRELTINKKYTVTATYYISGNFYTAVDSATPRVKYNKEQCDEPCYFVYDRLLDLRLKYTK